MLGIPAQAAKAQTQMSFQTEEVYRGRDSAPVYRTFNGTVGPEGKTFLWNKDHQDLKVTNPEELKGYVGQHVMVLGTENPYKAEVTVRAVKRS